MKKYKIIGIVTLYHPQKKHIDNICKMSEQVDVLFVADNSLVSCGEIIKNNNKIVYCFNTENKGLSGAFNCVFDKFKLCFSDNDMIIFFDQDTVIPAKHVEKLVNEYYCLAKTESVGALGPVYIDEKTNLEKLPNTKVYVNENTLKVGTIITSSMLCEYKKLKKIGFWNENVFLDMADWDLCWRLRAIGQSCYLTCVSPIYHSVGENNITIGGKEIITWKPFRYYYQIRDGAYLIKQRYVPIEEKINITLNFIIRYVFSILFTRNRRLLVHYALKGFVDFCKGYTGIIDGGTK